MAVIDVVRTLVESGAKAHEIKQALRQVEDEVQLAENEIGMPDLPELPPATWAAFKANLRSPEGPRDKHAMLKLGFMGMDADDQAMVFRALRGLFTAAWAEHPGLRQDLRMRRPT